MVRLTREKLEKDDVTRFLHSRRNYLDKTNSNLEWTSSKRKNTIMPVHYIVPTCCTGTISDILLNNNDASAHLLCIYSAGIRYASALYLCNCLHHGIKIIQPCDNRQRVQLLTCSSPKVKSDGVSSKNRGNYYVIIEYGFSNHWGKKIFQPDLVTATATGEKLYFIRVK